MHHRSTLKQCLVKEVLIVHIYRLLLLCLLICRMMQISSVTLLAVHRVVMTSLDKVEDLVIISTSMAVEDMSRRNFVNFVPISLRIAREADIAMIEIIIFPKQGHLFAEMPRPSRETKDMESHRATVVDIISSKRLDIIQDRALVRHIVIGLRSSIVKKAEAEESDSVGYSPMQYAKRSWI